MDEPVTSDEKFNDPNASQIILGKQLRACELDGRG